MSDAQLRRFVASGLLERSDGGYLPDAPDRVLDILEAESVARSLSRRVVHLRGDYTKFPVPAASLRKAMIELAPTIRRPIRKLRLVERAWSAMASRSSRRRPLTRPSRLPALERWPEFLQSMPVATYDARATGWYTLAHDVLPFFGREVEVDLDAIPLEERVVMVAVLDAHGSTPP